MPDTYALNAAALDKLLPMHVIVDPERRIRHAGPTLIRMRTAGALLNRLFFDVFAIDCPGGVAMLKGRPCPCKGRMRLAFRAPPHTALRGQALALDGGAGVIVNLSFGIAVVDAVAEYGLTVGDFAVTDLAVDLLYLSEAKSAVTAELRRLNQRLQGARIAAEEQACTDTLTGLKNRRALDDVLSRLICARQPFGLMHLDLDHFKTVNDRLGHAAGDRALIHAAHVLLSETRERDVVARVGGDEFVLVFDGLTDPGTLERIAGRIIERLQEPIACADGTCRISASIGAALSAQYAQPDPDTILRDADRALYRSKRAGRARASFARPAP
ncbi:GGDEF domain-containing protein [Actibacterium sp. MT2.3-13A]|uniref:GGDEF domain-containing protein n=1 Tax=Actibacterium sp. MT2.3-13A TaxID=2828332 RepID=UPI001BABDF3A|nr:GGDEF domain-containing protein [Actibacterium sp. MT2.3-13A]